MAERTRGEEGCPRSMSCRHERVRVDGGNGRGGLVEEGRSIRIVDNLTRGRIRWGFRQVAGTKIDCARSFHMHAEGEQPFPGRGCSPG